MDDQDGPLEADGGPIGTATVLAVIAATMVGFAAVGAALAVGVLDGGVPPLPDIRDDGTDGKGIPNLDPGDLHADRGEDGDGGTENDTDGGRDGAENASGADAP